jgi:hypothetical protein
MDKSVRRNEMKDKTVRTPHRIVVITALLVIVVAAHPRGAQTHQSQDKSEFTGCRTNSWEPEVLSYYGDSVTVLRKLDNYEMNLPKRRIFMFLAESKASAELSLFELADEKKNEFHVWHWKGNSAGDLREEATETILKNRGVACVGKQIKSLVMKLKPEDQGEIPAVTSATAAFGHAIRTFDAEYIRTTVFLLC